EGRVGQRPDELVVRRLADGHHFALDHGAGVSRQMRRHAPGEALVDNLERAQLILGELIRPAEVVTLDRGAALRAQREQVPHGQPTTWSPYAHCTTKSTR